MDATLAHMLQQDQLEDLALDAVAAGYPGIQLFDARNGCTVVDFSQHC